MGKLNIKNARCIGVQNPLALTSDLAPGPLMVDFRSKVSPVMGMSGGSIATSLHTFFSRDSEGQAKAKGATKGDGMKKA